MPKSIDSQRGVALLTILLLVVSITIVAGSMLASQKIAIRRSGLLFNQNQLLQDIDAGQQLAVTILRADNKINNTDSAQDVWAQPLPPYSLSTHSISTELRDEASRFNINNLYHNGAVDSEALSVFERLLAQLNLAPEIAVAVLDWQDADREVYKDGGDEQTVYRRQGSSDSSLPNQPFITIEQLTEVRGVDADVLSALRPFITAVPYYLPININTASPTVLAALMDGASSAQMQALVSQREQQVLTDIDSLWQLAPLNTLTTEQRQALAPLLAVDSQAFMALITATDSNTEETAKQRFATILISNTHAQNAAPSAPDNAGTNATNADNNNVNKGIGNASNSDNSNDNKNKEVKIISQRLWAFRPNF